MGGANPPGINPGGHERTASFQRVLALRGDQGHEIGTQTDTSVAGPLEASILDARGDARNLVLRSVKVFKDPQIVSRPIFGCHAQ